MDSNLELGNLLVVDDDRINRGMLSAQLQKAGHRCEMAENGREALEKIESGSFDMVLLDVVMPEMDGLTCVRKIRETYNAMDLPVIMVTAKGETEDVVQALESGANDYVTKPLDMPVVLARVQTQLSLKRMAELKDEFLRIASHDLKNPLTSMKGFTSLLAIQLQPGATVNQAAHDCILRMGKNAVVMQRIIEDFLDFSALKDGRLEVKITSFDLAELVRESVEAHLEYAKGKSIALTSEIDASVETVQADGARLGQVVQNLVGNAIKFGSEGTEVVVRLKRKDAAVVFEVCDSGPGLTDEDLKKVFGKYARLSNKPTGAEKSSGLGLSICKQLVEMHHGEIGVYNNPDCGATFWFSIPDTQPDT